MSAARPTVVLVDGSNVARCSPWRNAFPRDEDIGLRQRLLDTVAGWGAMHGHELVVVFDGEGPLGSGDRTWRAGVRVIGSGERDGDAVIEREGSECRRTRRRWWLVTSDRAVQQVAGAGAERVLQAERFASELIGLHDVPAGAIGDLRAAETKIRVADLIGDDVRAGLERMRRGDAPD